jgi:hypothetical protein
MAIGVVVSRGSSGAPVFSSGSRRSQRVVWSPRARRKRVRSAGTLQGVEQQVGGGVVAPGDGRLAELADGHALADVLLDDRRIAHQHVGAVGDAAVQALAALVDAAQDGGRQGHLEGAAHAEALVAAPGEPAAVWVSSTATPRRPPLRCSNSLIRELRAEAAWRKAARDSAA